MSAAASTTDDFKLGMATSVFQHIKAKNRTFLLFIITLFVLPLALAWLLVGRWQPGQTVNKGELLTPAQPVFHLQLRQPNGDVLDASYLQGHWTLVYPAASCDERCKQGLYHMRQVRLALGKDMERAQILYLQPQVPDAGLVQWLAKEHPAATSGGTDEKTLDFFRHAFPGEIASLGQWIYIIDPLGNMFIRYGVDDDPKGILTDLKRLFKYSKLG